MGSGVADIPDSVARALLDALQEKRIGNQLPAAMAPLARIRASQLQKCITITTTTTITTITTTTITTITTTTITYTTNTIKYY